MEFEPTFQPKGPVVPLELAAVVIPTTLWGCPSSRSIHSLLGDLNPSPALPQSAHQPPQPTSPSALSPAHGLSSHQGPQPWGFPPQRPLLGPACPPGGTPTPPTKTSLSLTRNQAPSRLPEDRERGDCPRGMVTQGCGKLESAPCDRSTDRCHWQTCPVSSLSAQGS